MKIRNPVTLNMLKLKRNSVHGKTKKAIRRKEKVALKKVSYRGDSLPAGPRN